jgi:ABC-type long-subunit fatty acid transport system fused permease/ATPase subunit
VSQIVPETVEAVLDDAKLFGKNAEDLGASLNTRGSALVAFGAIILTLLGVLHQSVDEPLGFHLKSLPPGLAILALLVAVGCVIFGVLIPRQGTTIAMSEIKAYPTNAVVTQPKERVQGKTLMGLVVAIERERNRNAAKARWLKFAYIAVALGLLFVALDAIVVASQADDGRSHKRDHWRQLGP